MEFLQELNESRMYRRLNQLTGQTNADVAEKFFEHMLALQILANETPNSAKQYAKEVWRMPDFNGFRTSQPDLFNLIVLMLKPTQYNYIVDDEKTYYVPELRLKRVLRNLHNGQFDNRDYSELMLQLQRYFDNLSGVHMHLRRQVGDWKRLQAGDRANVLRRLLIQMRNRGVQSDLYVKIKNLLDQIK